MLRYIEIAEGRSGGLLEFAFVVLLLSVTFILPKATQGDRPIRYWLVRFLLITYFPLYIISLGLNNWGAIGQSLHFVARLAFGVAFIRLSLLLLLEILIPKLQGQPLPRILVDLINGFIYAFATLWLLQGAGLDAVHLLTTGTVLGAIIGLSLQETLGNIFAGLAVQAQAPFKVGQWIALEGEDLCGEVQEINWRTTRIITDTDQQIDIPNALIARSAIRNYQAPSPCYEEELSWVMPFGISPFLVQRLALQALDGHPQVDHGARPPRCGVSGFGEDGVRYKLRYHTEGRKYRRDVQSAIFGRLWQIFAERGLSVGYPVRQIHMEGGDPEHPGQPISPDESEAFYSLAGLPFLAPLALSARRSLAKELKAKSLGPGDILSEIGENFGTCFLVRSGLLSLTAGKGPSGTRRTISVGDHVGVLGLLTGAPIPYRIQALGSAEVYVLKREQVGARLKHLPLDVTKEIANQMVTQCAQEADALRENTPEEPGTEAEQSQALIDAIIKGMGDAR